MSKETGGDLRPWGPPDGLKEGEVQRGGPSFRNNHLLLCFQHAWARSQLSTLVHCPRHCNPSQALLKAALGLLVCRHRSRSGDALAFHIHKAVVDITAPGLACDSETLTSL